MADPNNDSLEPSGSALPGIQRKAFIQSLGLSIKKCAVGLLIVDIRQFRRINHTFGMELADRVLGVVFDRLNTAKLKALTVYRTSANEFALILPELLDGQLLVLAANKIRAVVEEPIEVDNRHVQLKVHIGYAACVDKGKGAEEVVKHAELLLGEAKQAGVPYVDYNEEFVVSPYDWQFESELNLAIANNELELYFQPKIALNGNTRLHVEALARWRHIKKGMVPPIEFIPLAEQIGAIKPLTKWALHSALRCFSEWPEYQGGYSVAVNLSVQVLEDDGFLEQVTAALNIWGVSPSNLTLEVTEGAFVHEEAKAVKVLHELKAMGVCISIDDFGTGYSCLSYFKHLPADELKIDKSFIDHLLEDSDDLHLAQLMIDLGHHFGMSVVAEGIENEATFNLLRSMGCDYAQGFYGAKPMPQNELLIWIKKQISE